MDFPSRCLDENINIDTMFIDSCINIEFYWLINMDAFLPVFHVSGQGQWPPKDSLQTK